jgi:hypothetical protein
VVQKTVLTAMNTAGTLCASGTWSPVTGAGNLLVYAIFFVGVTTPPSVTPPSGWVHAGTVAGASTWIDIWYYPNNPGGLGSGVNGVTFTVSGWVLASGGGFIGYMEEFADSAGSNATPLDLTGTKTGTATPQAIAASGTTAHADELAFAASAGFYSSSTKDTLTPGSGFTQQWAVNNATKNQNHVAIDAQLDTGGSAGVTPTDSVTFTGPFTSFAGAIATFAPFAPPALSLRSAFGANSTTATSATSTGQITLPAGWQPGDMIFVIIRAGTTGQTITQTAGSTFAVGASSSNSGGFTTALAYRIMQAGDTAPTFGWGSGASWEYMGAAVAPPAGVIALDVAPAPLVATTLANTFTPPAATAAGGAELSLLLTAGRHNATGAYTLTYAPPAGWTTPAGGTDSYGDASNTGRMVAAAYQVPVGGGSVAPGTESITDSVSGTWTANVYHVLVSATAANIPQLLRSRSPLQPVSPARSATAYR